MSTLGVNIGLKALLAAQASLETIGHNLANASTPGYSRQRVETSTSLPMRLRGLVQGTGLQADAISRAVDTLLHGRITSQHSMLGRLDARLDVMSSVESLLGGASDTGTPVLFKKMFQAFAALSTAPEDATLRTGAVQSAASLATGLQRLADQGATLGRDVFLRLRSDAEQVNRIAERIGDLNRQISGSELGAAAANDLRDAREQALVELSRFVDVRSVEEPGGAVRVLVGGRMLVSPTTTARLEVEGDPADGQVGLRLDGEPVDVTGGEIGGLLAIQTGFLPRVEAEVDLFARNLILESNRVHSTGVPASGSFRSLTAANALVDQDHDGSVGDELLANAGLPFEVSSGDLYVNLVDEASGSISKHRIAIDASRTSAAQLVAALDGIPHLSAAIDASGRVQIGADAGFRFDFSARLDPDPDEAGSFGGGSASLATQAGQPFALAVGDTLDFTTPSGSFSVVFGAASFAQIGAATASEVAAALEADPGFQASGLIASTVGGQLVVQTSGTGASETFQVTGGAAAAALGWGAGTTVAGSDFDVAPKVSGTYGGASTGAWTFTPNMDGTIGTTPGLVIEVRDEAGVLLASLDVGPGYAPGDEIDVLDGVRVAFGYGEVSQSDGDLFRLDVVADSDSSDALVALGLNSLFVGHDARTIAVRDEILDDPGRLATSVSGAPGDGSNVLRFLSLEADGIPGLGGRSLDESLADVVSGVGLEIDAARGARETESALLDSLESRRDEVSGVNTDEELVHMVEQEQAYSAAAQYLRVVNEITAELINIL